MSSVLLRCPSSGVSPASEQRIGAAMPGSVPAEAQRLFGSSQLHQIGIKRQDDAVGTHRVVRRGAERQVIPARNKKTTRHGHAKTENSSLRKCGYRTGPYTCPEKEIAAARTARSQKRSRNLVSDSVYRKLDLQIGYSETDGRRKSFELRLRRSASESPSQEKRPFVLHLQKSGS